MEAGEGEAPSLVDPALELLMPQHDDLSRSLLTLDQASTLIAVIEMSQPGFPRWIGFWLTLWCCLSKEFSDLHGDKWVCFAFTRCNHRDRALPAGISCPCGSQIRNAEQAPHRSIWGIRGQATFKRRASFATRIRL